MNWDTLFYAVFHVPCLFHLLTGLYCPGCGGTRAVKYLLHGQIGRSFLYHPLVLYGAVVLAAEAVSLLAAKISGHPEWHLGRVTMFSYIGVGIVLVNWIIKNFCLIVLEVDLLAG